MWVFSGEAAKKHIQQGPFEVVGRFFRRKEPLTDLLEAYFYDYSISPLMVQVSLITKGVLMQGIQENYINVGSADISDIANAADSISEGDLLDAVIHGYYFFSLAQNCQNRTKLVYASAPWSNVLLSTCLYAKGRTNARNVPVSWLVRTEFQITKVSTTINLFVDKNATFWAFFESNKFPPIIPTIFAFIIGGAIGN